MRSPQPLLALMARHAGAAAATNNASLAVLGFSRDGSAFAFEQFGWSSGNSYPFSELAVISAVTGRPIVGAPFQSLIAQNGATQERASLISYTAAQKLLADLAITEPGVVVARGSGDPSDPSARSARRDLAIPRTCHGQARQRRREVGRLRCRGREGARPCDPAAGCGRSGVAHVATRRRTPRRAALPRRLWPCRGPRCSSVARHRPSWRSSSAWTGPAQAARTGAMSASSSTSPFPRNRPATTEKRHRQEALLSSPAEHSLANVRGRGSTRFYHGAGIPLPSQSEVSLRMLGRG